MINVREPRGPKFFPLAFAGRLQDALTCYERLINVEGGREEYHKGVVDCFFALHQPLSALTFASGMMTSGNSEDPSSQKVRFIDVQVNFRSGNTDPWPPELLSQETATFIETRGLQLQGTIDWNAFRVEAAWKLGDWSSLDNFLAQKSVSTKSSTFGFSVGRLLSAARQGDKALFHTRLDERRQFEMIPATAACLQPEVYMQVKSFIRLAMLWPRDTRRNKE